MALHVTAQLGIVLFYIHLPNSHKSGLLRQSTCEWLRDDRSPNSSHGLKKGNTLHRNSLSLCGIHPPRRMRNMKHEKDVQGILVLLYGCWRDVNIWLSVGGGEQTCLLWPRWAEERLRAALGLGATEGWALLL